MSRPLNLNKILASALTAIVLLTGNARVQAVPVFSDPPPKGRPNIVVIITDDQRYNTIRALGGRQVITPHMDSLARSGTVFDNAFNMGGWHGAVCVASRTMFLTGLPLWRARKAENDLDKIVAASGLWSQQLKRAGYDTYMTGKWHIRTDVSKVFDHVRHERPGMPNQTAAGYNRPLSPSDTAWTPWNEKYEGFWKGGRHWSEVVADDAELFFREAADRVAPFFMYLAFNAPHDPRQAPKKFVDLYPVDRIAVPENFAGEYPFKEEIGSGTDLRDEQLAPFPRTAYAVKKQIQEYYASITHLDEQVGRIMRALAATGKLDNTYIFFTSDHGLAVGQHGLMGKQNMYDHSVRVPLIVAGPGIPKAETRDQLVYLQDIAATTYELAAIDKKPADLFYKSLLHLIRNRKAASPYSAIYGAYMDQQRMVRTQMHKLIVYPAAERMFLFDLEKDPHEMHDVSRDPAYEKILAGMKKRLAALQRSTGDTLNLAPMLNGRTAPAAASHDGWLSLFNGKDLRQWRSVVKDTLPPGGWVIKDGMLSVLKGRRGGDIISRDIYGDFELRLDFRLTPGANSGVKYLVNKLRNVTGNYSSYMGLEYQIIDDGNYEEVEVDPAGDISTGSVYLLYPPENKTLHPAGQWNEMRIIIKGKRVEHWLNGTRVAAFERGSDTFREKVAATKFRDYPDYALADSGRILIQDHGDEVSYRNIYIRRLDK